VASCSFRTVLDEIMRREGIRMTIGQRPEVLVRRDRRQAHTKDRRAASRIDVPEEFRRH